ncbi:MAG: hypothetical protein IT285_11815 [Bdellovibrionales bacterium]|nr:hypothetical protein [Bdellovibrionales bacterium]
MRRTSSLSLCWSPAVALGLSLLLSGCYKEGAAPPTSDVGSAAEPKAPGKPATKQAAAPVAELAAAPARPPEPKDECFTLTFKHQDLAAHRDGEACLHHPNLMEIPAERLNRKSVCVRVNGTPVKHAVDRKHAGRVLIGAVAGPQSEISVRYCTGKLTCKEDCSVPKDEFLSAIGGAADGGSGFAEGQGAQDDAALEKELRALNDASGGGSDKQAFSGWLKQGKPSGACGTKEVAASR